MHEPTFGSALFCADTGLPGQSGVLWLSITERNRTAMAEVNEQTGRQPLQKTQTKESSMCAIPTRYTDMPMKDDTPNTSIADR